jgi:hypothetical protein
MIDSKLFGFIGRNKQVNDSGYVEEVKSSSNHPAFYNSLASVYPEFADHNKICIQQQFRRSFVGDVLTSLIVMGANWIKRNKEKHTKLYKHRRIIRSVIYLILNLGISRS